MQARSARHDGDGRGHVGERCCPALDRRPVRLAHRLAGCSAPPVPAAARPRPAGPPAARPRPARASAAAGGGSPPRGSTASHRTSVAPWPSRQIWSSRCPSISRAATRRRRRQAHGEWRRRPGRAARTRPRPRGAAAGPGRGAGSEEASAQQIGEQMVIAPPSALLVERDAGTGWPARPTPAVAGRRCAPRRRRRAGRTAVPAPMSPAGTSCSSLGLAVEHLLGQVVQHEAVAAGELLDESADVAAALQRQRGQLQARRPSPRCARRAQRRCRSGRSSPTRRAQQLGGLSQR